MGSCWRSRSTDSDPLTVRSRFMTETGRGPLRLGSRALSPASLTVHGQWQKQKARGPESYRALSPVLLPCSADDSRTGLQDSTTEAFTQREAPSLQDRSCFPSCLQHQPHTCTTLKGPNPGRVN